MKLGPLEREEDLEEVDRISEGGPYRALATVPKYEDDPPPEPVEPILRIKKVRLELQRDEYEDREHHIEARILRLEAQLEKFQRSHKAVVQALIAFVWMAALAAGYSIFGR